MEIGASGGPEPGMYLGRWATTKSNSLSCGGTETRSWPSRPDEGIRNMMANLYTVLSGIKVGFYPISIEGKRVGGKYRFTLRWQAGHDVDATADESSVRIALFSLISA